MFLHQPSGLYLTEFRAYDPVTGRWLSRDPSGEVSDPEGNLYAYVNGDPVNYVDPDGLQAIPFPEFPFPIPPIAIPGSPENNEWINSVTNAVNNAEENAAEQAADQKAYHDVCDERPPPCLKGQDLDQWKLDKAQRCLQARQDFTNKWYNGQYDVGHQTQIDQLMRQIYRLSRNLGLLP
jgi:RHS repeat-associated protein